MDNTPVSRWFEDKIKAESTALLLHAIFLAAMFPFACLFLFGMLMCSGYLFAVLAPRLFLGGIAANFLIYPVVRIKFGLQENRSTLTMALTAAFIAPHLLWESISEFRRAYRMRYMSISPFLSLLQAAWGSEGKVSINALSSDEDEAHELALVLSKFPEVFYLSEERTISLSEKALAQLSVIDLSQ